MSRVSVEREFFREHRGVPFDEALHTRAATIAYAVENYLDALPELRALYPEHWREIALDHDAIQLEPDDDAYERMAFAGILHLVTARADGELVGYHISMIHPHLHYRSSLTCFTDVFYLKPAYRSGFIGYRLLRFFRDSVRARGVQKVYMGTKIAHDIGPLLARLGFTPIERLYALVFR